MHSLMAQGMDSLKQLGLYALPLIGSVMLTYALFNLFRDLRHSDSKRVKDRLREGRSSGLYESSAERAAKQSILRQQRVASSVISAALSKLSLTTALQQMLDQANISWSAITVLINLVGLSAVGFIATYMMKLDMWICITASVLLLTVPIIVIYIKRKIRLNKLMNQLPDVFELMSQALRAGHSLANAILLVSQQLSEPVSGEFARVFHEQNLGIKIEDALRNMAKRVGMLDVRFFVTAVLIQRQTGGDLAEVLDKISSVIRDRIKLFGTVRALTAEGRLSGWVLLALPIVVFIVELVINPEYANALLDTQIGQYMLITGAVMQLLGLALIQKIVNIKV